MQNTIAAAADARGPLIVALGDSLTAGYGLATSESFAAQLERRLGARYPAARVINAGVSGDTSGRALARLPGLLSTLSARPDLVIVQLGANDLIQGVPLARTRIHLDTIIRELRRMGLPVLLARMEAPVFLGAFGQACNAIYGELSERHGISCHPFLPPRLLGNAALCLPDRVHPNARGVAAIVDHFLPAVLDALDGGTRNAA